MLNKKKRWDYQFKDNIWEKWSLGLSEKNSSK